MASSKNRMIEEVMATREFWKLSAVSDQELLRDLNGLVAAGARMEARFVAHLAEVEERRLHLKAATSSLFDYCLRRIGLSESEAFHRITAARLARKFPLIFELLEARAIHLSALRVLRDHLTSENHRDLLANASGKSKKEVEALVAALAPRPDVATLMRKLPEARRRALPAQSGARSLPLADDSQSATVSNAQPSPCRERVSSRVPEPVGSAPPAVRHPTGTRALEPLSSSRYLLRLSISHELKQKLERARDLMSHANASGELPVVIEKALALLLEKLEKQRFARSQRSFDPNVSTTTEAVVRRAPAAQRAPAKRGARREHIPNEIRRAVAMRDDCQCTYVDDEGRRCPSRAFLQLHHQQAYAFGGASTLENLRLLCGPHNRLLAEQDFGRAHQERFTNLNPAS
jgi:5-methylcytosine-specific restriction endonuclease McrA